MYKTWEKDFTLVNWDQRGAGKTFGYNAPAAINMEYYIENPLSVERMTKDGIELTKYLLEYFDQERLIIVGTSWGSILGAKMALSNPELYNAYIGHSQVVNFSLNIQNAYFEVLKLAKNEEDKATVDKLTILGKPPYNNAKDYGILLRIIKKYEAKNSTPAPEYWWKIAPEYDNEKDNKDRYNGDDYSFINFVGHEKLGIKSMVSYTNFNQNGLEYKIPIYIIQGKHDILTLNIISKSYFDKINAPKKEFFLLSDAAHGHNQSVVDKQLEVVKNYILIK
jgi:pimeloyl-ACP methyl ester carboxylesterase